MKYVRRIAALLLGTTFAASVGQAGAQPGGTYPSKPIRIIVSIAAGSLTDVVARTAGLMVKRYNVPRQ